MKPLRWRLFLFNNVEPAFPVKKELFSVIGLIVLFVLLKAYEKLYVLYDIWYLNCVAAKITIFRICCSPLMLACLGYAIPDLSSQSIRKLNPGIWKIEFSDIEEISATQKTKKIAGHFRRPLQTALASEFENNYSVT